MVYDLEYGTLNDLIIFNEFDPHETCMSRAIIDLSGSFNNIVMGSPKATTIIALCLDYKGNRPRRLAETTLDSLESIRLVWHNRYAGTFYYIGEENLLDKGKIPYRAEWFKDVKLETLYRWQHVLQDYPDTKGEKLKCRNLRTMAEIMFPKNTIVEQLLFWLTFIHSKHLQITEKGCIFATQLRNKHRR